MKKRTSFIFCAWLALFHVIANIQPTSAQTYTALKSFGSPAGAPGGQPYGKMVQAADGTLYGLNTYSINTGGNQAHDGTVFKIRPDGTGFTILKSFTNYLDGSGSYGGLWLDGQTLYGTRSTGGASGSQGSPGSGKGVLFKINTDGTGFTALKHFSGLDGENPRGRPLVVGGVVYGTTYAGGLNGSPGTSAGTIYRINTDGSNFAVLKQMGGTDGSGSEAGLVFSEGMLYGTTLFGGAGGGTVFAVGTNGVGFEVLRSFSTGGSSGYYPYAGLTLAGGKLYGANSGGRKIFALNTDGSGFNIITTVPNNVGEPKSEIEIQGDTIFGTAVPSNPTSTGSVFRVFTDGTGFEVLKTFSGGSYPTFLGINVWGNKVYGLTTMRELQNLSFYGGQIFSMGVDGSSFTRLKELAGTDGELPYSGLTQVGEWLYGVTYQGGSGGVGVAYKVKSDGSGYTVLQSFSYPEVGWGRYPLGEIETDAVNPNDTSFNLYGVTSSGGQIGGNGGGIIYRMNNNGGAFQVLTNLDAYATTNGTGSTPSAGLLHSDYMLYGTAKDCGPLGRGVVFRLNTDGTGFTVLTDFPGNGGSGPRGKLELVGNTLYGTTEFGGDFNHGTVFKVNTDGSGFSVLRSFPTSLEGRPKAGLLAIGNALFGTGSQTAFRLNTDGSNFVVLKNFSGDGISWLSGLNVSGGSFYGASRHGGSSGFSGVVYKLNPDGSAFEIIHTFANATGSVPEAPVVVSGGEIYGTTTGGGTGGRGVVYRIKYSEETPVASSQSGNGSAVLNGVNGPTNLVGYYEWQSGQPWQETRLAIQFPLPISLNPASIQSATLRMFYVGDSGAGSAGSIRAHPLLQSWNNTAGMVFPPYGSNFTATSIPATPVNTWISLDVSDAARNWATDQSSNHGLILVPGPDSPTNNYYQFISRNHVNPALHPVLELVYRNPTQHVGSVTMAITPPASVTAGAQWRMDGGSWLNSGAVVSNVPAGNHQIEFKPVLEWTTPEPVTVRVIGSRASSNSIAYVSDPLVGYNVGAIPTQYIYGVTTKVLKVLNPLGGQVDYYGISPYPGPFNYSAATGIFQYTPATTNFPAFGVTFGYYGPSLIQQVVYFLPSANVPPGAVDISFSGPLPPPGDEDAKYLKVSAVTNASKSFNNQMRATRSIEIAGKTVVIEQGHTNGLYEAYTEDNDIETFRVHAETLIVRSPLRLPQTDVTLYARELRFDGNEANIETTPRSLTSRPANFIVGQNGLDAGDITVFIESLTNQPAGPTRFLLKGGDGQPGGLGLDGASGNDKVTWPYGSGVPSPNNTTAFHRKTEVYGLTDLFLPIFAYTENYYWPNSDENSTCTSCSWLFDNPLVWKPTDGINAVPGGKSGDGGGGGTLHGNLRLMDYSINSGGYSRPRSFSRGGRPGTPQPAYRQRNWRDEYYFPFPPPAGVLFDEDDLWLPPDTHISQPGQNALSPGADLEIGFGGSCNSIGNSLSWLSPMALSMVVTNAEDAYLGGYFAEAEGILADYDSLLTRYQSYPEWQQLSGSWQTDFINLLAAIQTLRQRIASHTFNLGSNAILTTTSPGSPPLTYQWLFNGAVIAGATNESLTLTNLRLANQGNYSVIITNSYGSVTSSVTALNLNLPPGYFQLKNELLGNGSVRLTFIGEPGQPYALDRSVSLFPLNWLGQVTNVAGPTGGLTFTNAPDPNTMNFWRIRSVP